MKRGARARVRKYLTLLPFFLFVSCYSFTGASIPPHIHTIGIPIVEDVVDDILELRVRKNFEMMLMTMEERLLRQRYQLPSGEPANNVKGFVVMGHPYNFQHLVRIFDVNRIKVLINRIRSA